MRDDIAALPHLIAVSQRMMTTIKLNMTFSMALNFAAIALAMAGILDPVAGALVHNAGSVLVISNSALLLRWKRKGTPMPNRRVDDPLASPAAEPTQEPQPRTA